MKTIKLFSIASVALSLTLVSCGGGNKANNDSLTSGLTDNSEEYMNSEVNAIDQALPEIMVLPSDGELLNEGCLKKREGKIVRKYEMFLLNSPKNKTIVSTIQNEFVKMDYPLNDLEQTLKQLATREATDEADGAQKDAKTLLMETASPDIIIEYESKGGGYILSFIDPYTNKVFSSKQISGDFNSAMHQSMGEISRDLRKYFSDILTKGREISVRFLVDANSNISMDDESIYGDTYSDWVRDYMKTHTVKGVYKLKINTGKELAYTNVRIPTLNEDGTQTNGYDWARACIKAMRNELGVSASNKSQGMADVVIEIKKL